MLNTIGIRHTGLLTASKLSANLYDIYHCCVYSEKLLTMDRGTVQNMQFYSKNKLWEISASSWFYYKNLSRCTVTWTSNCAKYSNTSAKGLNCISFINFPYYYQHMFCSTWCVGKCTCKFMCIIARVRINFSLYVLNVTFPACRPSFAEVAGSTWKVERALPRGKGSTCAFVMQ